MPRKLPKLDDKAKKNVVRKVAQKDRGKKLVEASKNILGSNWRTAWREVSEEMKEVVLYRTMGGETLKAICDDLGIKKHNIMSNAYIDKAFAEELCIAMELGQFALVDELMELPFRDDMTHGDKTLLADAIKWTAERLAKANKSGLGDFTKRVEVHEESKQINIILPQDFNNVNFK